jgi:class 3 adenylate cyclase/tetratricopeptide (TPR) repeat protein
MLCASCGEENPVRFRFCGVCGAALPTSTGSEARKVVTLVFADVSDSTALGERLDPESVRWVMSGFFELARGVLERHGGTVEKFIGDAVMAAFGIPRVREDDALRGVRAAAELRDETREFGQEVERRYGVGIGVRIGVNTGEVVAGDVATGQAFASGDAVNLAARLEQVAAPGEVLLSEATMSLVRDAVAVEPLEPLGLKGKSERVPAWRLVDVVPGRPGVSRRLDAPLIGRESELAQLRACWQTTVDEHDVRVVTVVAPAGTGKSRLIAELATSVQPDATVVAGGCLSYGEGIAFWPIRQALRQAAGIGDNDSLEAARQKFMSLLEGEERAAEILDQLAPVTGLPGASPALEETFWAIRRLLEVLARRRPLVIVLDDLHWAEETLLNLIEYLAGWMRGVPVLLVGAARPELFERRAAVSGGHTSHSTLLLEPLGAQAADELLSWQLGAVPLSGVLGERILRASEGNPLFVQELVRMLIGDGLIVRGERSWKARGEVEELALPPTIQALLAARLDQLAPAERELAQCAAVVGDVFSWSAVRELSSEPAREGLSGRLHTLVRKQLIVPEAGATDAEDAFRFAHVLIRDAAYAGLAKRTRAALHEQFADWLAAGGAGSEEILGYHLEQAALYSGELGDAGGGERLSARASAHLAAAGGRALVTGDFPTAANLLGRAAEILPAEDPQRLTLRLQRLPALCEIGRLEEAESGVEEVLAHAREQRLLLAARAWRCYLDDAKGATPVGPYEATVQAWLAACAQAGDHAGQATALGFLAKVQFWLGRAAAADDLWLRVVEHASLAGDAREETEALVMRLILAMYGPLPVPVALKRCDEIADRPSASQFVRVMASIQRGVLEAMQGHTEQGRERVAQGRTRLQELGLAVRAEIMAQEAAIVEFMAGDAVAAEQLLRPAFDRLGEMGATAFQAGTAGALARASYAQHKIGETKQFAEFHAGRLGNDEFSGIGLAMTALVAAHEGDDDTAVRLAREAVARVETSDWLVFHADRLVDLADVHALAGRRSDATSALDRADALYRRKGCEAALDWTAMRRESGPFRR